MLKTPNEQNRGVMRSVTWPPDHDASMVYSVVRNGTELTMSTEAARALHF